MLGGRVARKLIAQGKPVRVMVRQPSSIAGVESAAGDLKDPASLAAACQGVTAVITTANSAQRSGADDHPAAMNRRLVLRGPEALSWSDIVEKTAKILGKPVPVRSIEPGQPIPSLPPPLDAAAGGMAANLEQQDVIIDAAGLAGEFGVTLTPAETVLRRLLAR
jgi:NADH dehydrogenase